MSHRDGPEEHDLGLAHDLPTLLNRRRALGLLSGAGLAAAMAACGVIDLKYDPDDSSSGAPAGGGLPNGPTPRPVKLEKGEVPAETGGPYPADGTNGVNVLNDSGIVRSDITRSFGGPKGVAKGVPTTIELTVLNQKNGKAKPYRDAAIYVWQCDAKGRYSLYDETIPTQNYLRGLQVADKKGRVRFRSIFPAAYSRRWPHIHFEVYESQEAATKTEGKIRTSQIALPENACREVYATSYYALSRPNFAQMTLKTDPVFFNGVSQQMAKVTGSVEKGMTIALTVAV
jgi:protocatechuate 3,4-dioxygenase beta subunit